MFKDKFKKELDALEISSELEKRVLDDIKKEKERLIPVHKKSPTKKRWIAVLAAAIAVVIVSVSVFSLPILDEKQYISTDNNSSLSSAQSEISSSLESEVEALDEVEECLSSNQTTTSTPKKYNIKFPTIKHTAGVPANITHNQIYQLFLAIYQTEQQAKENEGGGTSSKLSANAYGQSYTDKGNDYSSTNIQVEGVDEADIVKNNGECIYTLDKTKNSVTITKVKDGEMEKAATIDLTKGNYSGATVNSYEMYLSGDYLVVIVYAKGVVAKIYNVSDYNNPKLENEFSQSGSYTTSRLIGNNLYLFTSQSVYGEPNKKDVCSYVPSVSVNGGNQKAISEKNIYIFDGEIRKSFFTVSAVDITNCKIIDSKSVLGGGDIVYANTKSIYIGAESVSFSYEKDYGMVQKYQDTTRIISFSISNGKISPIAEGYVAGRLINQFAMDEYNGYLRLVTTKSDSGSSEKTSAVYILNKSLKTVGSIVDIAEGETLYSVRFFGDIGYFVTYKQVDPLFAVDLKDPKTPKILSALKIPGFSNYLHLWDDGLLLGIGASSSGTVKLSMFDISNPENVSELCKTYASDSKSAVIGKNHKAITVSKSKDIIGFAGEKYYYIFGFTNENRFRNKKKLAIPCIGQQKATENNVRGIYIGDYFYICNRMGIHSYCIADFETSSLTAGITRVDELYFK